MSDYWVLEPVPDWLRAVVDAVLPDLQQPQSVELELGFEPPGSEGATLWLREPGQHGGHGFVVYPGHETHVELIVRLADWLQDQVFPESDGAWGEARPECPGHPHPAKAVELDGEAWWVCPADGGRIARIGRHGASSHRSE